MEKRERLCNLQIRTRDTWNISVNVTLRTPKVSLIQRFNLNPNYYRDILTGHLTM